MCSHFVSPQKVGVAQYRLWKLLHVDAVRAEKDKAISSFQNLVRALADVGLETEVRSGEGSTLLVFVKAADEYVFSDVVYRSRYIHNRVAFFSSS